MSENISVWHPNEDNNAIPCMSDYMRLCIKIQQGTKLSKLIYSNNMNNAWLSIQLSAKMELLHKAISTKYYGNVIDINQQNQ